MIKRLYKQILTKREGQRQAELYRNLMRHEAKLGGELFGPVPKGHRREFFCFDRHTWVWHEEWIDASGRTQTKTTRYDVRPGAILKAQDGQPYQMASPEEIRNLHKASKLYKTEVVDKLYNFA